MKLFTQLLAAGLFGLLSSCGKDPVQSLHQSGWQVPALFAPDQLGTSISLKSRTSGPWAIVFFYPKADTPG